jgi:ascorbate-specific PTS system EIIC-type component UlaA
LQVPQQILNILLSLAVLVAVLMLAVVVVLADLEQAFWGLHRVVVLRLNPFLLSAQGFHTQ